MAVKYEDNKNVTPSPGSRHHATERPKYPGTIEFASEPAETRALLDHCIKARRPGGEYRAGHGFKTISCHCNSHPCKCGTETAKSFIDLDNVNE